MVFHITHEGTYSIYGELFFSENRGFFLSSVQIKRSRDNLIDKSGGKKASSVHPLSKDRALDKFACSCKCH